jgi:transketolase
MSSPPLPPQTVQRLADSLRRDVLRSTAQAGSGHPTSCLSCAELVAVLFARHLRFDVSLPTRLDNDHFILSKGHAAPILWALMYRAGAVSESEMLRLREIDSELEGHPTPRSEWVRVATGSLGQGLSAGLGMALADRLEGRPTRVYVLLGDGELAEGSCWEAAQLASHHHLDRVCAIVDVNGRGQTGPTMLGHDLETLAQRFRAFGWFAQSVDGHDPAAIDEAFEAAKARDERPSVILARTVKGAGVPDLEGERGAHGKAAPDLEKALAAITGEEIAIPVAFHAPQTAPVFPRSRARPVDLKRPGALFEDPISPRKAFGQALADWGRQAEHLLVFDGEVSNSTYTNEFEAAFPERFIPSFIAEQNMVGMALGAGQRGRLPVVATFAAFFTRAFDQLRMAAISGARMVCVGTHAGTVTGEDGPSQMGLEDVAMFRVLPGSVVLQPADGPSTVALLECLAVPSGIAYLRLIRPGVEPLYGPKTSFRLGGSHTLKESSHDRIALLASGATVHTALAAAGILAEEGLAVRVIDLYSIKPLDLETLRRTRDELEGGIVVEDHYAEGGLGEAVSGVLPFSNGRWHHLAIRDVPRSGDPDDLAALHGISVERIVELARSLAGSGEPREHAD